MDRLGIGSQDCHLNCKMHHIQWKLLVIPCPVLVLVKFQNTWNSKRISSLVQLSLDPCPDILDISQVVSKVLLGPPHSRGVSDHCQVKVQLKRTRLLSWRLR